MGKIDPIYDHIYQRGQKHSSHYPESHVFVPLALKFKHIHLERFFCVVGLVSQVPSARQMMYCFWFPLKEHKPASRKDLSLCHIVHFLTPLGRKLWIQCTSIGSKLNYENAFCHTDEAAMKWRKGATLNFLCANSSKHQNESLYNVNFPISVIMQSRMNVLCLFSCPYSCNRTTHNVALICLASKQHIKRWYLLRLFVCLHQQICPSASLYSKQLMCKTFISLDAHVISQTHGYWIGLFPVL